MDLERKANFTPILFFNFSSVRSSAIVLPDAETSFEEYTTMELRLRGLEGRLMKTKTLYIIYKECIVYVRKNKRS